jgi:hypothetical protein
MPRNGFGDSRNVADDSIYARRSPFFYIDAHKSHFETNPQVLLNQPFGDARQKHPYHGVIPCRAGLKSLLMRGKCPLNSKKLMGSVASMPITSGPGEL